MNRKRPPSVVKICQQRLTGVWSAKRGKGVQKIKTALLIVTSICKENPEEKKCPKQFLTSGFCGF